MWNLYDLRLDNLIKIRLKLWSWQEIEFDRGGGEQIDTSKEILVLPTDPKIIIQNIISQLNLNISFLVILFTTRLIQLLKGSSWFQNEGKTKVHSLRVSAFLRVLRSPVFNKAYSLITKPFNITTYGTTRSFGETSTVLLLSIHKLFKPNTVSCYRRLVLLVIRLVSETSSHAKLFSKVWRVLILFCSTESFKSMDTFSSIVNE